MIALKRLFAPVVAWLARPVILYRLAIATLISNIGIVVTGGAVRLTDSGLGCDQWPKCTEDSYTTTAAMGIHGAVEFGNRMLTFVLILIAGFTWLAALAQKSQRQLNAAGQTTVGKTAPGQTQRRRLIVLSFAIVLAIPMQGVIGGIVVWTDLNPWIVSLHFFLSMVLIGISVLLVAGCKDGDGPVRQLVNKAAATVAYLIAAAAALTIIIGVIVTGSGPHAGDADARRTGLDPELMSQLHADAVWLLIGLSIAFFFILKAIKAPAALQKAALVLLIIEGAQGIIGYVQYYTNLPELLVGMHMLGASLLWMAVVQVLTHLTTRHPQISTDSLSATITPQQKTTMATAVDAKLLVQLQRQRARCATVGHLREPTVHP